MKNRLSRILISLVAVVAVAAGVMMVSAQEDSQPFLGITFQAADGGIEVTRVLRNSPADDAGLERGDIITAINGETTSADTAGETIGALSAGDEIALEVLRGDETLELTATLAEQPARPMLRNMPQMRMGQGAYLGISLEPADDGVRIAAVSADSPAAEAGLLAEDVITAVNGEAVTDPVEVAAAVRALNAGDTITLSILRDGEAQDIEATLGSMLDQMPAFMGELIVYDGKNWQIVALSEDSALAAAGLQAGDVVTAVDGENYDPAALDEYLSGLADDATVTLSVERAGETVEVTLNPADLNTLDAFGMGRGFGGMFRGPDGERGPRFEFRGPRGQFEVFPGSVRLGVQVEDTADGALITSVLEDTPAAEAGLQVDDVIAAVNGDVVDAERTLRERLLAYDPGDVVTLDVQRAGETLNIDVTLAEVDVQGFLDELPFEFDGEFPRFFFGPNGPNGPMNPAQPAAPAANL